MKNIIDDLNNTINLFVFYLFLRLGKSMFNAIELEGKGDIVTGVHFFNEEKQNG